MAVSKVYAVDAVELTMIRAEADKLVIGVAGRTASTGWRNPKLSPHVYAKPPKDGVQELDFLARAPEAGEILLPVLTPIHTDVVVAPIDIADYWGRGRPLVGIRVVAVANAKLAEFAAREHMPAPRSIEAAAITGFAPTAPEGPSFEANIKPLFRTRDVACMRAVARFDLHKLDDVKANAASIHARLADGTMPTDGPWPPSDVDLFKAWIDGGMAA